MKKVLLLLFTLCAIAAQANTYQYLVFTNTACHTTALSVNNLTLQVKGNELHATNNDGTVNFTLTELQTMQFSVDGTTNVENVLNADAPVEVFSLTGATIGTYTSLIDAAQQLNAGTYVISNGKTSQTIQIKN